MTDIDSEEEGLEEETPVVTRPAPPPLLETLSKQSDNLAKARAAKAAKALEAMSKEKARTATAPEIDQEKVQELLGLYDRVSLEVKRTDAKGHIGTIETDYHVDTKQLLTIEAVIEALCGGGDFVCRVRDRDDLSRVLIDKFRVRIEAPPRPKQKTPAMTWGPLPTTDLLPTVQDTDMQPRFQPQFDANGQLLPPPPSAPIPPMVRQHSAQDQWSFLHELLRTQAQSGGQQPMGGERIALAQNQQLLMKQAQLEAQIAKKDEKLESLSASFDAKIMTLQKDMERQREEERRRADKAERDAIETRHAADLARLEAKFGEKKSGGLSDPAFLTALGTILSPFVLGYMGNAKEDRKLENERFLAQTKASQDQQTQFMQLILSKKESGSEAKLMELMVQMADQKAQNGMSIIKMMSDLHKDSQPADQPWWLDPVKQLLGTVEGAVAMAGMKAGPGQAPALPQGQPAAPALEGAAPQTVVLSPEQQMEERQWQNFASIDQQTAQIVYAIFQNPALPVEMRTSEWRILLWNLHRKADIETLVDAVANHLDHLREFALIPPQFSGVFEKPRQILGTVIKVLPISQMDSEYANNFVDAITDEIETRERERLDDSPADDPPIDATAVSVPS